MGERVPNFMNVMRRRIITSCVRVMRRVFRLYIVRVAVCRSIVSLAIVSFCVPRVRATQECVCKIVPSLRVDIRRVGFDVRFNPRFAFRVRVLRVTVWASVSISATVCFARGSFCGELWRSRVNAVYPGQRVGAFWLKESVPYRVDKKGSFFHCLNVRSCSTRFLVPCAYGINFSWWEAIRARFIRVRANPRRQILRSAFRVGLSNCGSTRLCVIGLRGVRCVIRLSVSRVRPTKVAFLLNRFAVCPWVLILVFGRRVIGRCTSQVCNSVQKVGIPCHVVRRCFYKLCICVYLGGEIKAFHFRRANVNNGFAAMDRVDVIPPIGYYFRVVIFNVNFRQRIGRYAAFRRRATSR